MRFLKAFRFLLLFLIFFGKELRVLSQSLLPPIQINGVHNACFAGGFPPGNGFVTVAISSWGVAPYSYLWSTGDTSSYNGTFYSSISNLIGGTYSVTVTDSAGIDTTLSYTIGDTPAITEVYPIAYPLPGINSGAFSIQHGPNINPYAWYPLPLQINVTGGISEIYYQNDIYGFHIVDSLPEYYFYEVAVSNSYCSYEPSAIALFEYPIQNVTVSVTTQPACNGANNGAAIVAISYPAGVHLCEAWMINNNLSFYSQGNASDVYNFLRLEIEDSIGNVIACHNMGQTIFNGLAPGNYTLKVIPVLATDFPIICSSPVLDTAQITVPFVIPNSVLCGTANGKVFFDENSDCSYNNNDVELPYTILKFNPGNLYAVTDASGNYNLALDLNNYTIQQTNIPFPFTQLCPDSNFVAQIDTAGENDLINFADSINASPNLRLMMSAAGSFRPNTDIDLWGWISNSSPYKTLPTSFTATYDTSLAFISVYPTPVSSQSGSFTWNIDTLNAFSHFTFYIRCHIPPTDPIGTLHCISGNILATPNETDSTDNIGTKCFTVQGSYDPNEIIVEPSGFDPDGYITNTEDLIYTILFQNTGNDTAFYVEIIDTLPNSINFLSIELLLSSHQFIMQIIHPGIVKFIFNNIQLPDSAADELNSHGLIQFKVKQTTNNLPGTIISNSANIIFDFNAPVQTNTVTNTIFDCSQMASVNFNNPTSVCIGDTLIGNATVLFPMQASWYLDSILVTNGLTISLDSLSAGNHTIEMIASNSFCSQSIIQNIYVDDPVKPTINVNGNLLTSSSPINNQWYLNSNPIAGAIQNTYTIQQGGWYMLSVSDSLGCIAFSDSIFISPVGISEISVLEFNIYPNLSSDGSFNISYQLSQNNEGNIEIFDINGKSIYKMNLPIWSTLQQIKLSDVAEGIYNCVITSENERVSRKVAIIK